MTVNLIYRPRHNKEKDRPLKATLYSAGYDLSADIEHPLEATAGAITTVHTGVYLDPTNEQGPYYIRVAPRSGLAKAHGYQILAGVIDQDYPGEILVLLTTLKTFTVTQGMRIAQIILEAKYDKSFGGDVRLGQDTRVDGFGSTGTGG
jgi:deoxyuridine 5'-triphosphate nucleotidohydrolase